MNIEQAAIGENRKANTYWEERKDAIYLFAAKLICKRYFFGGSVIDVGSNNTPTLEWHRDTATRLVSVDLRRPYEAPGVESVKCDFHQYRLDTRFDLSTCFQVLEHVRDPGAFACRLLDISKVVIVSVPYKWRKGQCKYHVHDPVDEEKMLGWFQQTPDFSYKARELNGVARLINVYVAGPRSQSYADCDDGLLGDSIKITQS